MSRMSQIASKNFSQVRCLLSTALSLILILTFASSIGFSHEDKINIKTIGGHVAECSETVPPPSESLQPMSLKMSSSDKQGSVLISNYEIQFVTCGRVEGAFLWTPVKTLSKEFKQSFKDDIGQVQSEAITFEKYRIIVTDKDGKIIQTIALDAKAKMKFKVNVNGRDITKDTSTNSKFVDVSLIADRIRQTPADRFFDEVTWGRYRLEIK